MDFMTVAEHIKNLETDFAYKILLKYANSYRSISDFVIVEFIWCYYNGQWSWKSYNLELFLLHTRIHIQFIAEFIMFNKGKMFV